MADISEKKVKPPLALPALHTGVTGQALCFQMQLSANVPG